MPHTPGPWGVTRYNDLQYSIYPAGTPGYVEQEISDEEDAANAALISATLDMKEALQATLEFAEAVLTEGEGGDNFPFDQVRKALTKAKGE